MDLRLSALPLADLQCDLLVVPAFEDPLRADEPLAILDRRLDGMLARIVAQEVFKGKRGQALTGTVHTHSKVGAERLLIVGMGPRQEARPAEVRDLAARASRMGRTLGARSVAVALTSSLATDRGLELAAQGLLLGQYRFDRYQAEEGRRPALLQIGTIVVPAAGPGDTPAAPPASASETPAVPPTFGKTVARAKILADAILAARDLVNQPPAMMTPVRLADEAERVATAHGLDCKILGPSECAQLGMGMFLGVAQGSAEEPRFIHLTYRPKKPAAKRVCLVGKGITFDSGGLSLKPSASMTDMKCDMAGAATVLQTIGALAALEVEVEVHAIAACAENMPSGRAVKLGDVLRSMSGKTVEVTNTDAEGRLTLGDALTYAVSLAPTEIIDLATLTGACVVALGPHIAGIMGRDQALLQRLTAAARSAGEEVWPLPLPDDLAEQLHSDVADLKNTGDRWAGASIAGLFLAEFAGKIPWAHIDIAGPAFLEKDHGPHPKGGTGFGVATLVEYLTRS